MGKTIESSSQKNVLDIPLIDNALGATPLDDVSGLLQQHITTRRELFDAEFANINKAYQKYLFTIPSNKKAPFTLEWLYKLHKEMLGEVWDWAGQKRLSNKSIGVDKSQIDEELGKLLGDYDNWIKNQMRYLEVAVRLHHRLVYIHPFENGNGRWSRMAANIYLRQNKQKMIQWPEQELYIRTTFREEYINALKNADELNYQSLIKLHEHLPRTEL